MHIENIEAIIPEGLVYTSVLHIRTIKVTAVEASRLYRSILVLGYTLLGAAMEYRTEVEGNPSARHFRCGAVRVPSVNADIGVGRLA